MKCPYCNKEDFLPWNLYANAENYGGCIYHVKCKHCRKVLEVGATRTVRIDYIQKSNKLPGEAEVW